MQKTRFISLFLTLFICLVSLPFCAVGDTQTVSPVLTDAGLDLGIHSVHWPVLQGLADETERKAINQQLADTAQSETLTSRLAAAASGTLPLTATWEGFVRNHILSVSTLAEGPVTGPGFSSVRASLNLNLDTGKTLAWADLFTDPEEGRAALTALIEEEIIPALSDHLTAGDPLPIPDDFVLSDTGITLLYPVRQLATLSGRAGTVHVLWYELGDLLQLNKDSVLDRIGAAEMLTPNAEKIRNQAAQGTLPGIPVVIGSPVKDAVALYAMFADPDFYDGGRYFELQDDRFRGVLLMTDALSEKGYDSSVVHGIRADRAVLYGLCVGQTTLSDWRALLGAPDATVLVDDSAADGLRIVPGTSDYYLCGSCRLRLHADADGVLRTIFLTE